MYDTVVIQPPGQVAEPVPGVSSWSPIWRRIALGIVILASIFMNFYQLGVNGFGNLYYASGVRSMADNLRNFFFVSFDPGGFVTIDKPPLGFWLQVVSVKVFGFTPFAIFFPQALSGVLAVLLLYILVQRHFGVTAGLLAALALAISPISVVTNRNNTIDSSLALVMLLGAWAVLRAAQTGRLRWLLLTAALIGLGFNIKMLEAYLVIPAFGVLYLLAAPRSIWTRIWHLAVAVVVLVVISFSWALAVDLTPVSLRPYVGSTQDNSEISLAIGYNGINRLTGNLGGRGTRGGAAGGNAGSAAGSNAGGAAGNNAGGAAGNNAGSAAGNNAGGVPGSNAGGAAGNNAGGAPGGNTGGGPGGNAGGGPGGAGNIFGTGTAGAFRLFGDSLGGQIAWLLPLALLGMLALAWQRRPRPQQDGQQQSLILWGVWLLTMGVFFSVAGFFHQYYLSVMAPAVCALFGIGVVVMWQDYKRSGWRGWLLPIALIATALEQINIINSNPDWGTWLIPVIAVSCALAALVLIVVRLVPRFKDTKWGMRPLVGAVIVGLIGILITPAIWSVIPAMQGTAADLPTAGPSSGGSGFAFGGNAAGALPQSGNTADSSLISYLEAKQGTATYLVATPSSMSADAFILATNKPVMAMGGFTGSDPVLTTQALASLVSNGTVRFFLLGSGFSGANLDTVIGQLPEQVRERMEARGFGGGGGGFGGGGFGGGAQSSLTSWITQHCTSVPSSQWQASSSSAGSAGSGNQLYDCASAHS